MTLTHALKETPVKELLRALNSQKNYLFFDISVFNVGASIFVKCTDTYKEINRNTWNGYNFLIENDSTTKFYISKTLQNLIEETPENFNSSQLRRAKKLIKENI